MQGCCWSMAGERDVISASARQNQCEGRPPLSLVWMPTRRTSATPSSPAMARVARRAAALLLLAALLAASTRAAAVRASAPAPGPAAEAASEPSAALVVNRCRRASTPQYSPVCGANNVTYLNPSWAACVGQPFTPGPCPQQEGRLACERACAREPYAVSCGVDGLSYANACVAQCAVHGWVRGSCCACPARVHGCESVRARASAWRARSDDVLFACISALQGRQRAPRPSTREMYETVVFRRRCHRLRSCDSELHPMQ